MKRLALTLTLFATPVQAQEIAPVLGELAAGLDGMSGQTTAGIVQMFALLTVLTLAPAILVVVTSFTRFIIAFSILRMGLGLQTTPANLILISLSLFMTLYVMTPVFDKAWQAGLAPMSRGEMSQSEGLAAAAAPFRTFMLSHVRKGDLDLFVELGASADTGATASADGGDYAPETVGLRALIPAFLISEIRRGFEIGFLLLLPFLAIDLIVATIVMAMGMMMLPPTVVSLPFKILFFVLIDGWSVLVGSMVRSFQ